MPENGRLGFKLAFKVLNKTQLPQSYILGPATVYIISSPATSVNLFLSPRKLQSQSCVGLSLA
jgi:hypothetical protein